MPILYGSVHRGCKGQLLLLLTLHPTDQKGHLELKLKYLVEMTSNF